ncbi:MAG: hypothetical protein IPP39_07950 [Chitinophagaceae bacterium]|nr:hypothetical protein [Chitinophagaceae bacterium]
MATRLVSSLAVTGKEYPFQRQHFFRAGYQWYTLTPLSSVNGVHGFKWSE